MIWRLLAALLRAGSLVQAEPERSALGEFAREVARLGQDSPTSSR